MKNLTGNEFIEKSYNIHGCIYDYSMVEYKNTKIPVKIICKHHGIFEQIPQNHLRSSGCPKCNRKKGGLKRRSNTFSFIKKSNKIHNNFYDYSVVEYKDHKTHVEIICPIHGKFSQTPAHHIKGHGCHSCGVNISAKKRRNDKINFIESASKIHNNFYDYRLVNYVTSKSKVRIICPIHNVFEQRPNDHISGYGCPKCGNIGLYKHSSFKDYNNVFGYLYLMEIKNNVENFLKIGITKNTPNVRKTHIKGYNIELLKIANIPLYDAFMLEQEIINVFSEFTYIPLYKFGGHTECFSNVILDDIQRIMNTIILHSNEVCDEKV